MYQRAAGHAPVRAFRDLDELPTPGTRFNRPLGPQGRVAYAAASGRQGTGPEEGQLHERRGMRRLFFSVIVVGLIGAVVAAGLDSGPDQAALAQGLAAL